ncbi:Imm21 family immunity protein [Kitasatospora sp. NPDC096147]|uniref:Imm21 family immunity protein n=1 Tax=Kitasatospora sp. NPDC096147 TaxID=3364093 RepID=UPI0038082EC4
MTRSPRPRQIDPRQRTPAPTPTPTWLDRTDSARYALLPEHLVSRWTGEEAYDAAGEYAASVRLDDHDVVVLGGEPLPVTWIADHLVFARWIAADDDRSLLPTVERALATGVWEDAVTLRLGGRYVLTDAGYDGEHILGLDRADPPELLRLTVPAGRYLLRSLVVDPDAEYYLEHLLPLD